MTGIEEFEITKGEELPPVRDRRVWPFKRMHDGDVVKINKPEDWPAACNAAHAVGNHKRWKFSCIWKKPSTAQIKAGANPEGCGMIYRTQ